MMVDERNDDDVVIYGVLPTKIVFTGVFVIARQSSSQR